MNVYIRCSEVLQYISSVRLFQASVEDRQAFPYLYRMNLAFAESKFEDSPQSLPIQLMPTNLPISANNTDQNDTNLEPVATTNSSLKRGADFLSSEPFECLLEKPVKRIKRSSSHMDMSFILSAKADRLRFSDKLEHLPDSEIVNDSIEDSSAEEVFWPEKDYDTVSLSFAESPTESKYKVTKNIEGNAFIASVFSRMLP